MTHGRKNGIGRQVGVNSINRSEYMKKVANHEGAEEGRARRGGESRCLKCSSTLFNPFFLAECPI